MMNKEIKDLVHFAKTDTTTKNKIISLGKINKSEIDLIKLKTGFDLTGYERVLDKSAIRHTLNNHGNSKMEEKRGLISVTENDFELIPEIVKTENIIYTGKSKLGKDCLLYEKQIGNTFFYVEEIRTNKKHLCLQTMYKRKPPQKGWFG